MNDLLEVFPFIKETMIDLEQQNKFLNKVTLTGKINALDVAANLFEFTDKTAIVFDELKVELINALLQENIKKVSNELSFKAKTAIDILIRNLFERTADVGFFSTDTLIIDFLTTKTISQEQINKHLLEYANKYSVYNEIVIFDTQGKVKAKLNQANQLEYSKDSIIQEALNSEEYVEKYVKTDIFSAQNKTLMYAQKILHANKSIGVLCLCFKFEDEMNSIFKNLAHNKEILAISDAKGVLIANAKVNTKIQCSYCQDEYKILNKQYISTTKGTSGYQGYTGIQGWYATAMQDAYDIHSTIKSLENDEEDTKKEEHPHTRKSLLNEQLNQIIEKANNIIEDIADVIINGELIASKQKVYVLTPILDNLRNISTELLASIKKSIKNLEYVVEEALIHDVKMASHLAIDIMDRNLYERANDSRWWALTPSFGTELSSQTSDTAKLEATLTYINELYTVYTNIFIYDANRKIIASSQDSSIVGETLSDEYIQKTLANKNSQNYFVSPFDKSSFYEDEATYIYSASIVAKERVIGGIAVVFDAKPEFEAMLNDSFPASKKGFMVFLDKDKNIISSNNPQLKTLEKLDIDEKFLNTKETHAMYDFITFNETEYIVASVSSQGYREYKTEDNYTNELFCLTFIEI